MNVDVKPDLKKAFGSVLAKMGDFGIQESAFNEAIGKGSFMPVGEHAVTIQSAELTVTKKTGAPMIVTALADKDGATIKHYTVLFREDQKTGETDYSRGYLQLIQALVADTAFKLDYIAEIPAQAANNKTTLVDALVGMKLVAVVAKGKEGYEIIEEGGSFYVRDVVDGASLIPSSFQSLSDAATMAKDEGFKRAFNNVQYVKADKEEVTSNEVALKKVFASVKTK